MGIIIALIVLSIPLIGISILMEEEEKQKYYEAFDEIEESIRTQQERIMYLHFDINDLKNDENDYEENDEEYQDMTYERQNTNRLLRCPNCGATLHYNEYGVAICKYCDSEWR